MQTEEETAAAEEPILEEGSDREQVNGMTFDLRLLAHVHVSLPAGLLAPTTSHLVTRNSPVTHPCGSNTRWCLRARHVFLRNAMRLCKGTRQDLGWVLLTSGASGDIYGQNAF